MVQLMQLQVEHLVRLVDDLLEVSRIITGKVELRHGSNDAVRQSIDMNRVIAPGRLALRIAGLHEDERYNQRPAFEKNRRIYGALTFEPYKSTAVRVNYEAGRTVANRPITVLPFRSVTDCRKSSVRPAPCRVTATRACGPT